MLEWFFSWQSIIDLSWLLFLFLILRYFWNDKKALQEAKNWAKTKGTVVRCEWGKAGPRIWPKIEYIYHVTHHDFIGEHIFLDTSHNTPYSAYARKIAYKAAMSYKNNQEIDVYYDPENPERSALDIHIPQKLNVVITLISTLIILHIAIISYQLLFG